MSLYRNIYTLKRKRNLSFLEGFDWVKGAPVYTSGAPQVPAGYGDIAASGNYGKAYPQFPPPPPGTVFGPNGGDLTGDVYVITSLPIQGNIHGFVTDVINSMLTGTPVDLLKANGYAGSGNTQTLENSMLPKNGAVPNDAGFSGIGTYVKFFQALTKNNQIYKAGGGVAPKLQSVQQIAKGAAQDVKDVGTDIGKVVSKVANDVADAALSPLIPLKPGMKAAIKVAKYPDPNPPDDTLNLAKEFVKKVIQGEQLESLEHLSRARGMSMPRAAVSHMAVIHRASAPAAARSFVPPPQHKVNASAPSERAGFINNAIALTPAAQAALQAQPNVLLNPTQNAALNQAAAANNGIPPGWTAASWAAYQSLLAQEQGMQGGGGSGGGGDYPGDQYGADGYPDDGYAGSDYPNEDDTDYSDDTSYVDEPMDATGMFSDDYQGTDGNIYNSYHQLVDDNDNPVTDDNGDFIIDPDYASIGDNIDTGDQDDQYGNFESLEKKIKYGLGNPINSGYLDPGQEEVEYLEHASPKEKKLYTRYKYLKRHMDNLESLETLESLTGSGAVIGGVVGSVVPGAGTVVGSSIGAIVEAILNWFKKSHTNNTTPQPGNTVPTPTQQEAAAEAATEAALNGMTQAQRDIALGLNPFQGWFENVNDDGTVSFNWKHALEAFLASAAAVMIIFAIAD